MRVMDDEVAFGDAVAKLNDFDVAVGFPANALVAILAENQGPAMLELQDMLAARIFFGEREPRTVVENVAVLQDLDKRRTFVGGGVLQGVFQMRLKNIDGTRDERGLRTDGQRDRIERAVGRAVGSRLGHFVKLRSR